MAEAAIALVLSKLEGIRKRPGYWMARCPAHEDREASLSVTPGKTQPVVLKCFAECSQEDILAAAGITWEMICAPREESPKGEWTPQGEAVAVYDYVDEEGTLLFQVCRTAGKQFPQRAPDASRKSGWRWNLEGTRRVLYRLPKLIEAVAAGEMIFVCEGEKDVHALERAGAVATCNPGGAGKWRPEYSEFLRGAIVRVVADGDKPGRRHARQVAASLEGVAAAVEIVEAASGKDAADHLAAGLGLEAFLVTAGPEEAPVELAPDLHEFLMGEDPGPEWVIPGLLERQDRLIWTGHEGLGKSMIIRTLAVAAAAGLPPFAVRGQGGGFPPVNVLYVDCENPERKSRRYFERVARAASLKSSRVPDGKFRIIHRPEGVDLTSEEDAAWLLERVTAHRPDILFIGPIYRLHTKDMNEELAARQMVAVLDAARAKAGCALVMEGHSPHGGFGDGDKGRSLRPVGSSLFLRWPEFGYGIRPAKDCKPNATGHYEEVSVASWRGPRDEREWPHRLRWSRDARDWPWVEVPYVQQMR